MENNSMQPVIKYLDEMFIHSMIFLFFGAHFAC